MSVYKFSVRSAVLGCTVKQYLSAKDKSWESMCVVGVVQDMDGGLYLFSDTYDRALEKLSAHLKWDGNGSYIVPSEEFEGFELSTHSTWEGNVQDPVFATMLKELVFLDDHFGIVAPTF